MMADVDFQEVRFGAVVGGRLFADVRKRRHDEFMRAGLSVQNIT